VGRQLVDLQFSDECGVLWLRLRQRRAVERFCPLNAVQQNAVRSVLAMYSAVANVTFNEVKADLGGNDFLFA
jgi:hypothetical protein